MKKVCIALLIMVILSGIGVGIYYGFFFKPEEPPIITEPPVQELTPAEKIIVDTALTQTQATRRIVDVKMPTFSNLSDYSFQEVINKKIADSINPYINEIAIVADETSKARYEYKVDFERYNNDNYVSIVVLQNYYTGPSGMRSNVWKDTYTVDVVNNKELRLVDVCAFSNYKDVIVYEVNRIAKEKNINLIAGNGLQDIPDTQRFYIKDKKLYIYFEPASIAPYLDGEMHFEMPFMFDNGKFILGIQ